MIVVIDSGVWISALQFGGTPRTAIQIAHSIAEIAMCDLILDETLRILDTKFGYPKKQSRPILLGFLGNRALVTLPSRIPAICRDPNDDMVVACARVAGAEIIVSGDKDLLALDPLDALRILTPSAFLQFVA